MDVQLAESEVSFSTLGSIHVHVDGGVARNIVSNVVDCLNRDGFQSKLTPITRSVPGPQRGDYWKTYDSHTPGMGHQEELDFFSTTQLTKNGASTEKLKQLLETISEEKGIVIEAEQVIGKGGQQIMWWNDETQGYYSSDVGFKRASTLPIEIHYSCDIPKKAEWSQKCPIELEELLDICVKLGIRVGGWFTFDDGKDKWAYRSNMFAEGEAKEYSFRERVQRQRDELATYLTRLGHERGFTCDVNVLVERSLGVWKTPLSKIQHFKTVRELARWEENYANLKNFWVLAPNFLGDTDEDFRRAMIRNFRRNVQYTYFLQSFADVQRLRHFAKNLSESEHLPFIFENIKVVLLNRDFTENPNGIQGEYFIANPPLSNAYPTAVSDSQGYKLRRSREREIVGGRTMLTSEVEAMVAKLQPLTEAEIQGLRIPLDNEDARSTFGRAVVYTDLSGSTILQEKLGDDAWAQVLLEYDFIVANEVSKLGGEVVKNLGDGYLLIFDQADMALLCAQRLQLALNEHNTNSLKGKANNFIPNQKIALDFGPVSKVMRAQGFDLIGKALSRCARLVDEARGGQVLMLHTFRDQVRTAAYDWIHEKTELLYTIEFKGLKGNYEVWNFKWDG
jgi:class 3 adenylate cyclase